MTERLKDALINATKNGNVEMVKDLLKAGVKPNVGTWNGFSPLHIATRAGNLRIMKLLLDAGADVNMATQTGWTPLHYAAFEKLDVPLYGLIAASADVTLVDDQGWTALHYAAHVGHLPAITALVSAGASVLVRDKEGLTPIQVAKAACHEDVAKLLEEKKHVMESSSTYKQSFKEEAEARHRALMRARAAKREAERAGRERAMMEAEELLARRVAASMAIAARKGAIPKLALHVLPRPVPARFPVPTPQSTSTPGPLSSASSAGGLWTPTSAQSVSDDS